MEILQNALENIGFDWRVALANLVNFIVVFWLIKRFVFAPMHRVLEERRSKINEGLENAQIAERERMHAEQAFAEKISEAKMEATTIVSGAHEREKQIIVEAQGKAHEEAEKIIASGRLSVEQERREAEARIKEETADMIVSGVEKILKEEISEAKGEELIRKVLTA